MNSKQLPVILALTFFAASSAYAGRDESLIQLTRKNQLAHDAKLKKEKEEQEKQQKETNAPAAQVVQASNGDSAKNPSASEKQ